MTKKEYIRDYIVAAVLSMVGCGILMFFLKLERVEPFMWILWLFFALTGPAVYVLAQRFSIAKDPNLYTGFSLLVTTFKMGLAILVFINYASKNPELSLLWVWPFFFIYFVFTIFEVKVMMKLSYRKLP